VRRLSYPLYLLENAPPARLAEVAIRRVGRALVDRLPSRPPPTEKEILDGFGVRAVEDLPSAFARPVPGEWAFADVARLRDAARAVRGQLPDEARRALEEAERIAQGRLEIFGTSVLVPRERRRVEEASPGWKAIAWERCPRTAQRFMEGRAPAGVDPKDAWVVGRLEHVVRLALASLLEPREGWADAALDWILDLVQAPRGIQWASPMEVALRAANVSFSLRALAATETLERRPRALARILQGLELHSAFVAARMEDTLVVPNNHLLSNVVGILVVGALVPSLARARARALLQAPRFFRLVEEQTLADGFTFEASVGYHRLAVELFTLGVLSCRALGVGIPPEVSSRIRAAFRASERIRDGRGETPQIGDADSGRALPFRDRHARDHRHLDGLGRLLFSRPPAEPSYESLWLFGAHEKGERVGVRSGDDALPFAGIHLQRSPRTSVSIACGPNGTGGTGTHGHNDKLSLEVCIDGVRVVADPGTGRYTSDPRLRDRLRGTAHHATGMVDGEEQQELLPGRLFALPERAHARCLVWEPKRETSRFVGEHDGYLRLRSPVVHRREVVLDRRRARVFVTDDFLGPGVHRVEVRYLLPFHQTRVRVRAASSEERHELSRTIRWVVEVLREGDPIAIVASAVAPNLEEGNYAEGYGQVRPATIVVIGSHGRLPLTIRTTVSPTVR
jgi:hypothetical protein